MRNPLAYLFKPKVLDIGQFFNEARNKPLDSVHELFRTIDPEHLTNRDVKRMATFLGVTPQYFRKHCLYR